MCGRFFSALSDDDLASAFGIVSRLNLPSRYNIAPTQAVPVVHLDDKAARRISLMRWGLVPVWAKDVGSMALFNARAETVAEKPAFRGGWRYRRGLVPASGWYEWQKTGPKSKQAYSLHFGNYAPLSFACVWEVWEGRGEGSWLESCAVLTTTALGPAAAVRERMPVIVEAGDQRLWLQGDQGKPPLLSQLSQGWVDRVQLTPVGPAIGNVANQGADLIAPKPCAA